MSPHKEPHNYDVTVTMTINVRFHIIAHSEEEARNAAWDYAQSYDFNGRDYTIEVQTQKDCGIASERDIEMADTIAEGY